MYSAMLHYLELFDKECKFMAYDGVHEGIMNNGIVSMKMSDVQKVDVREDSVVLDTGSPHLVKIVENVKTVNVLNKGKKLRFSKEFGDYGIKCVNFVDLLDGISIRTYERGDEMESFLWYWK